MMFTQPMVFSRGYNHTKCGNSNNSHRNEKCQAPFQGLCLDMEAGNQSKNLTRMS
jgi:hypothetical protein